MNIAANETENIDINNDRYAPLFIFHLDLVNLKYILILWFIMKKPLVLGFYGNSGSGKTNLIKKLIRELTKEGYKIAAVKVTNKKISIDTKGKETWEFAKSGAKLVVFKTGNETSYLLKTFQDENKVIESIKKFFEFDVILIEGSVEKDIPKIKIGNCKEREGTLFEYRNNFEKVISFIKQNVEGVV